MRIPIVQNPSVEFLIIFVNGAIITSLIPVLVSTRLIATIIEIIKMGDGFPNTAKDEICPHLLRCDNCAYEQIVFIEEL